MFWEHEGNAAVRIGSWKLVRKYPEPWELYDLARDRTELNDLAAQQPQRVQEMAAQYEAWAARCGVIPRERIDRLLADQNVGTAFWERADFKAPYLP
jgi:arylsulfatase